MNNPQQTARVGLFFVLGLALTWVTFQTLNGGKVFRDKGYTLIAGFESLKADLSRLVAAVADFARQRSGVSRTGEQR